jgi:hypothetical protein
MKISLKKILFMLMFATYAHEAQAAQELLSTGEVADFAEQQNATQYNQATVATVAAITIAVGALTVTGAVKCIKSVSARLLEKVLLQNNLERLQTILSYMPDKMIRAFVNSKIDAFMQDLASNNFDLNDNAVEAIKLFAPYCSEEMINRVGNNGRTLLCYFCELGPLDIVQPLLLRSSPETINRADNDGATALHWACRSNRVENVKALLLSGLCTPETINRADNDRVTALYWACCNNNKKLVKLLLPHCTRETINQPIGFLGWRVLHLACQRNHPEIVQALVQHGANTLIQNFQGQSPLDFTNQILANTPLNHAPTATPESRIRRRRAELIKQIVTGVDHDSAGRRLGRLLTPVGVPGRNSCAK